MLKSAMLAVFLFIAGTCFAQNNVVQIIPVFGPPSGACYTPTIQLDLTTGQTYSCGATWKQDPNTGNPILISAGTWGPLSGISLPSSTLGAFCYYFSQSSLLCDRSATTDQAGHVIFQTVTTNALTFAGSGALTIDFVGGTSVGNPAAGSCRFYYDTGSGVMSGLNHSGASCMPASTVPLNICLGQTFTASGSITQFTLVTVGTSGVATAGTGGGPVRGVAQASATNGNPVPVCFEGPSSLIMDATATAGDVGIPSTTTGGQGHDSGQTSSANIGVQTGDLGLISTGCTGSGCTATVQLKGSDQFGRLISATQVNGATVPASATVVGTNSSRQVVSATLQGNGSKVQVSTGSTTTNDMVKYDANGNTVDSGVACCGGSVTMPTTTGQGGIWSSGATGILSSNSSGTPANGTMYVQQLSLPWNQPVGHATFDNPTTANGGITGNICIYNAAGTSLLWSASGSEPTASGAFSWSATQTTLSGGASYLVAYEFTGTTMSAMGSYSGGGVPANSIINLNGEREATAANVVSGGLCPSSLGTLTNTVGASSQLMILLEP